VVIVEVHDHRRQQQPLLAAVDRTTADRAFEAIEEGRQVPGRALAVHVLGEPVHPFVGGTERTGGAAADEVVAEGLVRPSGGAGTDG
jgi:hypothetical protein